MLALIDQSTDNIQTGRKTSRVNETDHGSHQGILMYSQLFKELVNIVMVPRYS